MPAVWSNKFATKNLISHIGRKRYNGYNCASFRPGQGKQNKAHSRQLTILLAATTFILGGVLYKNLGSRETLFSSLCYD